jgi:phosphoribosyl 1,2-cyclic phosphodiesterase
VASPGESTLRYGGNTPCVEVRCGGRVIVLDAGTGIRELGLALVRERVTQVDLLISHFHMDHTQGFPFFTPSYNPDVHVDIHLAKLSPERGLEEPFHKLMEQPQFPVPFQILAADIRFHEIKGGHRLGAVELKTHRVNHPGGCMAYRIEHDGKALVYLTDHEPYGDERDAKVVEFVRDADLVIREAQYTNAEYEMKRGWGHSTFDDAAADAVRAGAHRLALFHHDPEHDDRFLERELDEVRRRYCSHPVEIFLAREGSCVELF